MKKATNNGSMKLANRQLILDMIRREPISRADIAQQIELTRASVTIITEELINEGSIYEAELVQNNGKGRSPVLLMLNPDGTRFGGINLQRDCVEAGIVNISGGTLSQTVFPYDGSPPRELIRAACEVLKPSLPTLKGIGICAPGPLDYRQGVVLNPPDFPFWHDFPVLDCVADCLSTDIALFMENMPNAMALEEKYFGVNKDVPNFASLLVDDTGIGLGVVLNDHLLRGATGLGNEIGHTTVVTDGIPCGCGNHGCLVKYASMPALLKDTPFESWHALIDRLDSSAQAQALLEEEAKYLSVALLNAINMLDIELVILKGTIAYNSRALCAMLNHRMAGRIASRRFRAGVAITSSEAPCSVRTAATPAIHGYFSNSIPHRG